MVVPKLVLTRLLEVPETQRLYANGAYEDVAGIDRLMSSRRDTRSPVRDWRLTAIGEAVVVTRRERRSAGIFPRHGERDLGPEITRERDDHPQALLGQRRKLRQRV